MPYVTCSSQSATAGPKEQPTNRQSALLRCMHVTVNGSFLPHSPKTKRHAVVRFFFVVRIVFCLHMVIIRDFKAYEPTVAGLKMRIEKYL